jgi:hypothetical protein
MPDRRPLLGEAGIADAYRPKEVLMFINNRVARVSRDWS